MNVVLLGAPGVGKGTTAKIVSQKLNLPHISTGDVLRAEIAKGSELGRRAREYVESGKLVPDELVTEIVREKLSSPEARNGFVLDGYPRTIEQANALKSFSQVSCVLNLTAPKKVIVERIKKRKETEGGRSDDDPQIVMQRITEYEEKTTPLIDFYRNEGVLADIDSSQDIDGVARQCLEALRE